MLDERLAETEPESLTAENESLRLLLEQADLDAKALILQVGIDAKEREASDQLQRLALAGIPIAGQLPGGKAPLAGQ